MKKITFCFFIITLFLGLISVGSCSNNSLPEPVEPEFCDTVSATYNDGVKAILDAKCAVGGCHNGSQSPPLTNYAEVSSKTDRIDARALIQQTMPPSAMPQLTNEELDILNCWKNGGYLEQ